jgi:hypothetical protein
LKIWKKERVSINPVILFIFFIFGILSVLFISVISEQKISEIFRNGDVQAILIVALPTLVIWANDMSARRNEEFNNVTESMLSLRNSFEERFSKIESDLKECNSDEFKWDDNGSRVGKIFSILTGDLDYLDDLLESRSEVLFQRLYLLEIFRLISVMEQKNSVKISPFLSERLKYSKTKILNYYFSIIDLNYDFDSNVINELFGNLNIDDNERSDEKEESMDTLVIRNIDFSVLPLNSKMASLKEKMYLRFINCKINIDTIRYLVKEDDINNRIVEFKDCELMKFGIFSKKVTLTKNDLKNHLSVSKVIIN